MPRRRRWSGRPIWAQTRLSKTNLTGWPTPLVVINGSVKWPGSYLQGKHSAPFNYTQMSYSRQYSEVVSGTGTETVHVSYPASQSGGTVSKTVTVRVDIPVHVNIQVDTNPFDH